MPKDGAQNAADGAASAPTRRTDEIQATAELLLINQSTTPKDSTMFRAVLIDPDTREISNSIANLITDEQWAQFAVWSYQQNKDVRSLISDMGAIVEEDSGNRLRIVGTLPHCKLWGCILPDGSCHT